MHPVGLLFPCVNDDAHQVYTLQCNYICNNNFIYVLKEHWGQRGIFVHCTLQEDTKPESKYVFISLGEGVTAEIYQHKHENINFLNLFLK